MSLTKEQVLMRGKYDEYSGDEVLDLIGDLEAAAEKLAGYQQFKSLTNEEFQNLRGEFTRDIANAVIKNGFDGISVQVWGIMVTVENMLRERNK
jgi:hypothetical protein